MYTIWFYVLKFLEKAKLEWENADQWLWGREIREGIVYKEVGGQFGGDGNGLSWLCW